MIHHILIPQIFENMEEATIGQWLKAEGETVTPGDALCELITEKTTFQLESDYDGTLRKIIAPEKAVVPVGALVAYIGEVGDELPAHETALPEAANEPATENLDVAGLLVPGLSVPSLGSTNAAPESAGAGGRVRATPAARRAARERGVAIEDIAAAFPGKVLSEDDVRNFAS
jgi:pyruvate dehydrogenase E2 component (dihydrolipoamide acetyltransferase)